MLRIDVDHPDSGKTYSIPADNPFVNKPGVRPEIWAYGLREPWRFSFDPLTHDLWVGDVGQDLYEEIDIVRKGENYGWNVMEGFERYSNKYRRDGETYVPPVFSWTRKYGQAVIGGLVYRGNPNSSFNGVYIFGDYQKKAHLRPDTKGPRTRSGSLDRHCASIRRLFLPGCEGANLFPRVRRKHLQARSGFRPV